MSEVVIKAGDTVGCPKCKAAIYRITKDISIGEIVTESMFRAIGNHSNPRNGTPTITDYCGEHWYNGYSIFILAKGWCPPSASA